MRDLGRPSGFMDGRLTSLIMSHVFFIFLPQSANLFVKYTVLAQRIIDFRKLRYNLNASNLALFGLFLETGAISDVFQIFGCVIFRTGPITVFILPFGR